MQPDGTRDVRGFACKVLGVPGRKLLDDERDAATQDFLLASAPTFFIRHAIDYVPFSQAVAAERPFRSESLRARAAVFDLLVQRQGDPVAMPIEDAVVRWDERRSPFEPLAVLTIPKQEFDTPENATAAEHLSFTPWHALPEHEPLGGINRVRLAVYREISTMRHVANDVARREPAADAVLPGVRLL